GTRTGQPQLWTTKRVPCFSKSAAATSMGQEPDFVRSRSHGSQTFANASIAAGCFGICGFQFVRFGGLHIERPSRYRRRSPSSNEAAASFRRGGFASAGRFGCFPIGV